ncbi:hypothetical protein TPHA_0C03060 [Tetrapisispora phaffii CBS 4417]|uniref:Fork-head domain-containing protein n=1 Tax=Tetrapisispora phaffii (strain ATCC 24235 / CBS 4417 / NBRC 1672 / NRRL Y-8282 / UCD 70-5) TaxID=1071381 RepID=G8BRT3_TETPH|nr:hypothetical protein TPHA_0C03060 [Tetrapisispora phaffii CBS 4417]CCE62459.1 hypothetical protein TPHA_0C03060 [Tetrapisispora phaffii CBS 4417]
MSNTEVPEYNVVDFNNYSPAQQARFIQAMISTFMEPEHPTGISKTNFNEDNVDSQIRAYAKISGRNWTYYVKDLEVVFGRNTNPPTGTKTIDIKNDVNIDLGPSKVVSRKHAVLRFNMQSGHWEIYVLGRNGAKVDFEKVNGKAAPYELKSGSILEIGGNQMIFILPEETPSISKECIKPFIPQIINKFSDLSQLDYGNEINSMIIDLIKMNSNESDNGTKQSNARPSESDVENTNKKVMIQPNEKVRTFKMYGSNNSKLGQNKNNNTFAFNNPSGTVLFTPHMGGSSKSSNSVIQGTYWSQNSNSSAPSIIATEFPQSLDFGSDLSNEENKNIKPPYSYATMIAQGILSTPEGVISLSDIYKYISDNYAYYRFSKTGWQNSIRHNLSLNKAFEKVAKKSSESGKGMNWRITKSYQDDFIKKWNSGKITKLLRRGSSVSRQLQLHMSKYNCLPTEKSPEKEKALSIPLAAPTVSQSPTATTKNTTSKISKIKETTANEKLTTTANSNPLNTDNSMPLLRKASYEPESYQQSVNEHLTKENQLNGNPDKQGAIIYDINTSQTPKSIKPSIGSSSLKMLPFPFALPSMSPSNDLFFRSPTKSFHVTAMETYTPERGGSNLNRSPKLSIPQLSTNFGNKNINDSTKKTDFHKNQLTTNDAASIQPPDINRSHNIVSSPNVWNLMHFTSVTNTPAIDGDKNIRLNVNAECNKDNDGLPDLNSSPLKRQSNRRSNNSTDNNPTLMLDTESAKITTE